MFIIAVVIVLTSFQIVNGREMENNFRGSDRIISNHLDKMENRLNIMLANIEGLHHRLLSLEAKLGTKNNKQNPRILIENILEQQLLTTKKLRTIQDASLYCCSQSGTTKRNAVKPPVTKPPSSNKPWSSFTNCDEAIAQSGLSGEYQIYVKENKGEPSFIVYCLKHIADFAKDRILNGNWLVLQRRQDGSEDFYRDWHHYKVGFGNISREFFLGLDKIYALTNATVHELWIQLVDEKNSATWALYKDFAIGSESDFYKLSTLGEYKGTAGDCLRYSYHVNWTTKDRDNDWNPRGNCALLRHGAWWYRDCAICNLNGEYGTSKTDDFGVYWYTFRKYESLKYVHMALRMGQDPTRHMGVRKIPKGPMNILGR